MTRKQSQELCLDGYLASAGSKSRLHPVEFLAADTQIAQDRSDGPCFQFAGAPIWDGRSAARRWTNPNLVIAAGASVKDAAESVKLARELAVSQTATMTSPKP